MTPTNVGIPVQQELGLWSPITPSTTAGRDEAGTVAALTDVIESRRFALKLRDAYYRGEQSISDLGISVPPQLRWLKVPLGWPRVCVDAIEERLRVQTMKCGTDGMEDELRLADLWNGNDLDAAQSMVHLDALIFGVAYVSIGANPKGSGLPVIRVESPLDMAVDYDVVSDTIRSALRVYGGHNGTATRATFYTPDVTIHLQRSTTSGEWIVTYRDEHRLGVVPIVRFVNRARSYDVNGHSEITPELMGLTDDASRTFQSMAVGREYYSSPQRYFLGIQESDFQDANGNTRSPMEVYAGRVLGLERDENGNLPEVGQFAVHDPSVFTKIIDSYVSRVSGLTGVPSHMLGVTTANPTSGDAIKASEDKLMKRVFQRQAVFGPAWAAVMRLALMFRDGVLPEEAMYIRTVWADTSTPTPMATAQAWTMVANAGIIPKTSRVLLDRLGLTTSEQEQIEADRTRDAGETFLAQLGTDVMAGVLRRDDSTVRLKNELEGVDATGSGTPSG